MPNANEDNLSALSQVQHRAVSELLRVSPVADDLARRFREAGFRLALVGGSVRDALLGRLGNDLDFTTDARPEDVLKIVRPWADSVWEVGIAFGTVGSQKDGYQIEITTYRSEAYDRTSRKPEVSYGDSIEEDLVRRDFTVNAMAVALPEKEFVDPHGGLDDLAARVLRTPGTPEESFSDDPLRMLRAARFAAQLDFEVAPDVLTAMTDMAGRIEIVSAERVREELNKLLLSGHPRKGLGLLVETGLADRVLPELPALRLERDEHHRHKDVYEHSLTVLEQAIDLEEEGPDLVLRLAALLHDIGKPKTRRFEKDGRVSFHHHEVVGAKLTRKRLTELKYSNDMVKDVSKLVELHLRFHGYGDGEWTDSAVRRYVRDAGPLLDRLHKLTRSDCTTRNKRKANALSRTYDGLEERIAQLKDQEELDAIRPDLDGNEIMKILGVGPGPVIGKAYAFLLELRLENGPMERDAAIAALKEWWEGQS
ncbi:MULTISPECIES: CCA tRNA nucleotidyltransferase [unclassified Streptomyces]|uniref:CCA tRNA nucleotidyltransferase n=1 Tax=Streptomyces flavovirens TaxID=52258 RepID=A0ABV8NBJ8_9ACTN|nr:MULTISPECIES: CCA tRNA nucleotidyltransferase [unclassified Streptomyces]MYR65784.1 CCA tRNA nucleotidyltransferase [Streptomyces sp. SID4939]MYR98761.1 CCA tRNA nucleotidyltransferase [Streptomyces sp. SID4940]MYT63546.1 CCA tRNA nucleotidyltransferase [Streptomyces sp. SID8357]MYT85796.1 CCA tRNA nucleotidyltransferase [Streptomyces sp. SID8360]MYW38653.1 CCA tRNA nucleotidyltransferase [Streptomyces sp. SID1]MYX75246.1 CCA tRNA nucleotidyltransferase [Streptomyces sp. SID3915]